MISFSVSGTRRDAADLLERGALSGPVARLSARIWERLADPVVPLDLPHGAFVVGVGGPSLGGSGKTPFAVALAKALVERSVTVAVVGHGYRAPVSRRGVRCVAVTDEAAAVGDDALFCARALAPAGVPVVVGRRREAVERAARLARVVLLDGVLQARPLRLACSILVSDDASRLDAPCPPAGDRRASRRRLLDAADWVALAGDPGSSLGAGRTNPGRPAERGPRVVVWTSSAVGVRDTAGLLPLSALAGRRVGVSLAVARPGRILHALHEAGVRPVWTRLSADHDPPRLGVAPVDVWLMTAKCATKLDERSGHPPVVVLEHRVHVPAALVDALAVGATGHRVRVGRHEALPHP